MAPDLDYAVSWLQLDQPLCMECGTRVKEEVEASIAEVEAECSAYEAAIAKLEGDKLQPLSEEVPMQHPSNGTHSCG